MRVHIPTLLLILIFTSTLEIKEIHEVIIIGAGISGLRASQILS